MLTSVTHTDSIPYGNSYVKLYIIMKNRFYEGKYALFILHQLNSYGPTFLRQIFCFFHPS